MEKGHGGQEKGHKWPETLTALKCQSEGRVCEIEPLYPPLPFLTEELVT